MTLLKIKELFDGSLYHIYNQIDKDINYWHVPGKVFLNTKRSILYYVIDVTNYYQRNQSKKHLQDFINLQTSFLITWSTNELGKGSNRLIILSDEISISEKNQRVNSSQRIKIPVLHPILYTSSIINDDLSTKVELSISNKKVIFFLLIRIKEHVGFLCVKRSSGSIINRGVSHVSQFKSFFIL